MSLKPKRIALFALLAFVVASVAFLAAKGPAEPPAPPETPAPEFGRTDTNKTPRLLPEAAPAEQEPKAASESDRKVIVYYFHTTRRCFSCRTLEALTKEAITGEFGEALKSGILEWKPVNTDEPGNEHFLEDYGLYTKSVVVADYREGKQTRYKVLQKAWLLLREKEEFLTYVRDEVRAYIERS